MIKSIEVLIGITLYSVVLFAVILLFRLLLKKQVSPKMLYLIWFLLIARLVIPITLETGFHFINIKKDAVSSETSNSITISNNNETLKNTLSNNNYNINENEHDLTDTSNDNSQVKPSDSIETPHKSFVKRLIEQAGAIHLYKYMFVLWVLGVFILFGKNLVSNMILHKYIKTHSCRVNPIVKTILNRCKCELKVKSKIMIIAVKGIGSPAITASFFPVVLLPKALIDDMNEEQLELSIRHELMHIKRRDNLMYLLLGLLKAMYWFNPIVYLMDKYMKMDIETACDFMVVRTMKQEKKMQYATTVLNMYARKKEIPLTLGMSLGSTKKSAERRIKGIYMRQQSTKKAKIVATILSIAMLVACFTTACQPKTQNNIEDPEVTPVVKKIDDNEISSVQYNMKDKEVIKESKYSLDSDNDNVKVNVDIDAKVIRPKASLPVVKVEPKEISFQQIDNLLGIVKGDEALYNQVDVGMVDTKNKLNEQIEFLNSLLKDCPDDKKEFYNKQIKILNYSLNEAMDSYKDKGIKEVELTQGNYNKEMHNLVIGEKYQPDSFRISNNRVIFEKGLLPNEFAPLKIVNDIPDSKIGFDINKAIEMAKPYVDALDSALELGSYYNTVGYRYNDITEKSEIEPFGYTLYYTKRSGYVNYDDMDEVLYNSYQANTQEYLEIVVGINGVHSVSYNNPQQVVKTINEDSELLPIDNVKEVFDYNILLNHDKSINIKINKIELSLKKIRSVDGYEITPVWDFIGEETILGENESEKGVINSFETSFMTINAIDGCLVNRRFGNVNSNTAKTNGNVKLYEGTYFDDKRFGEYTLNNYCEVMISYVTDTSFDFTIYQVDEEKGEREVIFPTNTAVFQDEGIKAIYKGNEQTLEFSFPDYHNAYPVVTDIEISGFDPLEGKTLVNNGIPGHEFG